MFLYLYFLSYAAGGDVLLTLENSHVSVHLIVGLEALYIRSYMWIWLFYQALSVDICSLVESLICEVQ